MYYTYVYTYINIIGTHLGLGTINFSYFKGKSGGKVKIFFILEISNLDQ